jgi:SNF2 family DNA or RNA helicase
MQRLIAERLGRYGKVVLLNGGMSAVERQRMINEFTMGSGQFFITTDAGNYGINLQCAKVLINVDLPWNPAVYEQRCGRIHRIGSTHDVVNIINLISADGLDETILDTLYKKKAYSDIIVEKNEAQAAEVGKLTAGLMKDLLKGKKKRKKGD